MQTYKAEEGTGPVNADALEEADEADLLPLGATEGEHGEMVLAPGGSPLPTLRVMPQGISRKRLVQLYRAELGLPPKTIARVLRFNRVIDLLGAFGLAAERRPGAPGVYVGAAKIAALGIRVTRGRAWHGIALNVDMDLSPFLAIDPCGYPGLEVTQARDLGIRSSARDLGLQLARLLEARLEHA